MLPARQLLTVVPARYVAVRTMAAAAQGSDPIQKLFLDKIREYSVKAKSAPNGLVDSNEKLQAALKSDMERVANNFGIKNPQNIADLGLKFEDTCKLDSINMK